MASGYLICCVRSKPREKGKKKVRFLKSEWAARRFAKLHIDPTAPDNKLVVRVFNSNGYPERIVKDAEAVAEFVN